MSKVARKCLLAAGINPTRRRIAIADLLFGAGDRHITAEQLYQEATNAGIRITPATVYRTLNQFKQVGLLREIAISSKKRYFDTKITSHQHVYIEDENRLMDVPKNTLKVSGIPSPPEGTTVTSIDVLVHVSANSG